MEAKKESREEWVQRQKKLLREVAEKHKYLMENDPTYMEETAWVKDLVTFGKDTDD